MPALIYEITEVHNIIAAFQLLDPTSISNPFPETFQPP